MFLAALIIRVDESNEGDETAQAQMSGLLITVIVIPFLVMVWYIVKEFRSELNRDMEAIRSTTARLSSNVELPEGSATPIDDVEMIQGDIENVKNVQLPPEGPAVGKGTPMDGNEAPADKLLLGTTL